MSVDLNQRKSLINLFNSGNNLPLINLKSSPISATTGIVCQLEADGTNWSSGSVILKLISDDSSATPLLVTDGTNTTMSISRIGNITTGGFLQLSSGGTIQSSSNGSITLLPNGTGISIIGDAGTTSHTLNTNDDLFIAGKLEVDGYSYFDSNSYFASDLSIADDVRISFGGTPDVRMDWSTAQATSHSLVLGLGNTSNSMIFTKMANADKDFDHSAQTNPTLFGHSAVDPDTDNTQWWGATHNQTDAVFSSGKGNFKFEIAGNKPAFWRTKDQCIESISPGGSGATLTVSNAILYYLLDATTEYLYFGFQVGTSWDEASDIVICTQVALNVDSTANHHIKGEIRADYCADHEDMDTAKTQTVQVNHDIVNDNTAGEIHDITFLLDWDATDNVIQVGDIVHCRYRLHDVAEVSAIRFKHACIQYLTKNARKPYTGTFPTAE